MGHTGTITSPFLSYDVKAGTHRSAAEEWQPYQVQKRGARPHVLSYDMSGPVRTRTGFEHYYGELHQSFSDLASTSTRTSACSSRTTWLPCAPWSPAPTRATTAA